MLSCSDEYQEQTFFCQLMGRIPAYFVPFSFFKLSFTKIVSGDPKKMIRQ